MAKSNFSLILFSVLLLSIISIPSSFDLFPNAFGILHEGGHGDDGHGDNGGSECTLHSLEDLAHKFTQHQAYIQFHTDDGVHPTNTGPGDLASPGEIRGNIGPAGPNTFAATIDASQQVLHGVEDPTLWDSVTATGNVVFLTGHHSDHIDFEITINDLHNVSGIHIHLGGPTENSHIHAVDLLTGSSSLLNGVNHGPITHMNGTYSGEISADDLCPGAHDNGHDSETMDFEITINDLHNVSGIHIHLGGPTENSHIHAVDLLTGSSSLLNGVNHGPITHMNGTYSGEISIDDLCPGAHGGDNGHGDDGHGDDGHGDGGHMEIHECSLHSLDDLAHHFSQNQAYIQFHTDDGVHPTNTGPGDLASPGEIRGNIVLTGHNTFTATIDASQQVLHGVEDPTLWDSVTATGNVVFSRQASIEHEHGEQTDGGNGWNTRPTFGVSHEVNELMRVDTGFEFNNNAFSVTDNHHTPFDEKTIKIGSVNTFAAKVWADKGLKVQEFLFGIPEVGMGHQAETRVEVWYDNAGEIAKVDLIQSTEVIDSDTLTVTHQKTNCLESDLQKNCDKTIMSAVFLEPLADNVMAIKAIDFKLRDQTTYLNDGFDISGTSLNPMETKMIPSSVKGEGLIKVTQNEKYSDYWSSDDGRIFEMNSAGSFKQINHSFERFQDSGNAFTRAHSDFGKIIDYEQARASQLFDSQSIESKLPNSFSYEFSMNERLSEKVIQEMIIQEHMAQKVLETMSQQARW